MSFGIVSHDGPGSWRLSCFMLLLKCVFTFSVVTNNNNNNNNNNNSYGNALSLKQFKYKSQKHLTFLQFSLMSHCLGHKLEHLIIPKIGFMNTIQCLGYLVTFIRSISVTCPQLSHGSCSFFFII